MSLAPMVEAIETEFEPVAIRNNVGGYEQEVREQFDEPSWNNPVLRFLDADGDDVLKRKDRVWSTPDILGRMLAALDEHGRELPAWLELFAQETLPADTQRAVFAMHCFWVGEARLGGIDGVVSARAAWVDGLEVVDISFQPERVSYAELLRTARKVECASKVFTITPAHAGIARKLGVEASPLEGEPRPAKDSDHLHDLARSPLRFLPLTPLQALRVNSALGTKGEPNGWLSPRQIEWAGQLAEVAREHPERLGELERPETVAELAAYTDELRAALSGDPSF